MSCTKSIILFFLVVFSQCHTKNYPYEIKGKRQVSDLAKGKFSIQIKAPETFSVRNLRLRVGKQKPEPKTVEYYESDGDPIFWPVSFFISRETQDAPYVSGKDLLFISDVETNKEYEFELSEGNYYMSIDSIINSELNIEPLESKEFFITFGFSHNFPERDSIAEVIEYKKKECTTFNWKDNRFARKKYRSVIRVHCPQVEITNGFRMRFLLSGGETLINKESAFFKLLLSMFFAPITNFIGYYTYRNYTAEMIQEKESEYEKR